MAIEDTQPKRAEEEVEEDDDDDEPDEWWVQCQFAYEEIHLTNSMIQGSKN